MGALSKFMDMLSSLVPAALVAFYEYLKSRVYKAEIEKDKLQVELDELKAKDEIDKKYAGRSPADIVSAELGRDGNDPKR